MLQVDVSKGHEFLELEASQKVGPYVQARVNLYISVQIFSAVEIEILSGNYYYLPR